MNIGSVDQFSELPPATDNKAVYWANVEFVIVSIWLRHPARLFVTDFTENQHLETEMVRENYIGDNYDDRISPKKILQLTIFDNKLKPFLQQVEKLKGEKIGLGYGCTNVLEYGIFANARIKFRTYNGSLDGLVSTITPLDMSTNSVDLSLPVFKNVITSLPPQFVNDHIKHYKKVIPETTIRSLLSSGNLPGDLSSSPFETPRYTRSVSNRAPILESTPNVIDKSTSAQAPIFTLSSRSELPSDSHHQSDFETPLMSRRKSRSPPRASSQAQPQVPSRALVQGAISKLNKIDICDGTSYDVNGLIVDFRPLQNQFCIKPSKKDHPILNPITLLVTGGKDDYPNEDQFLKVSFVNHTEILAFLGYEELEEVYLDNRVIAQKVETILRSKVIFPFKVRRRHIKINSNGNYILGWDGVDLTLDGLLGQIEKG